jgi:hypothetical protein
MQLSESELSFDIILLLGYAILVAILPGGEKRKCHESKTLTDT